MFTTDRCSARSNGIESPDSLFGAGNEFQVSFGKLLISFKKVILHSLNKNMAVISAY